MSGDGAGGGGECVPDTLAGLSERSALETGERRDGFVAARAETDVFKARVVVNNAAFGAFGAQPGVGAARIGNFARLLSSCEGVGAPAVRVAVGAEADEGRALLVYAKFDQANGFRVSRSVDTPPTRPIKQGGAARSRGGCGKA